MALDRINRAIATLCSNHELTLPEGTTIRVCEATEDEWNAFIESEDHELKSIHLAWSDGQVFIVELPSPERGLFCSVFNRSFLHDDIVDDHLNSYMTAFVRTTQPRLEADLSYGPLAGPLPGELQSYWQWHTLKAKRWSTFVGVRYVLCVAIWPTLTRAEYKLYTVQDLGVTFSDQDSIVVAAPATLVAFESRALLGLQQGGELPRGFPDRVTVDLYQVLRRARRGWL
ncbi:hypothetical protein PHYSODRAFT_330465 [Phytophthora sojae]|uniref:Uncharacterized protein n=1 Tax=Phytophthora sojae (strain P6497) TaxID=1094619 RepID=G4ZBD0_PHYSP|nr:hypothetical protein PHYSODRAFT_330465 [Phytophthora sojae]EGZ22726.1 hypothetical protein PHYSODRAFT_330465 [Phytophthora sojae]|eukprot:XP_009525443.1 hypothetical protein PHYSODRAFT_330465 [Phytophthora sojae]